MAQLKPLVSGNWKMNGLGASIAEAKKVAAGIEGLAGLSCDVMICPPYTLIARLAADLDGSPVAVGAQDCHVQEKGAHTGDISAEMLADAGATAVIVGHSERRQDHGETDTLVAEKAAAAWRAGLTAIICVGETQAQREAGETLAVIEGQLTGSVPGAATAGNTVVAYEPVWAIGTGLTPTPEDVEEVHGFIRSKLADLIRGEGAGVRLLYGGSVKPSNAAELMRVPEVNGALVGGASLNADDFLGIIRTYA